MSIYWPSKLLWEVCPTFTHLDTPLESVVCKGVQWVWNKECQAAFDVAKSKMASTEVLEHYNTVLLLKLDCDASAYEVGAVLSHTNEDGSERPIAYASRAQNPEEKNYAQTEKEGLALIFGVKKFHKFCIWQALYPSY